MSEWSFTPPGEVHEVETSSREYERFRFGGDYESTAAGLREEARHVFESQGRRMFITRATILGRMHQLKQAAWRARGQRRAREDRWDIDLPSSPRGPGDLF